MGKRRLYDEDVHDVFGFFGVGVAIYFEALRYRQQLRPGEFFRYPVKDINKNTGLSYKQQLRTHKILRETNWIETKRGWHDEGGTVILFRITQMAQDIIKDTPRRRNVDDLRRQLSLGFSTGYAHTV